MSSSMIPGPGAACPHGSRWVPEGCAQPAPLTDSAGRPVVFPLLGLPCEAVHPRPWPGARAGLGGQSGPVPTGPFLLSLTLSGALSEPFLRQLNALGGASIWSHNRFNCRRKVGKYFESFIHKGNMNSQLNLSQETFSVV